MSEHKILAFDVGIKHLAYCIMTEKNNHVTVNKIDTIDLTEPIPICCGLLNKTKKKCDNNAQYYYLDDDNKKIG